MKRQTVQTLAEATAALVEGEGEQSRIAQTTEDRETQRQELIESMAYQDALSAAQRVEELARSVDGKHRMREAAAARLGGAQRDAENAAARAAEASRQLAKAESEVDEAARAVLAHAPVAGLTESAGRHLPGRDSPSLRADQTAESSASGSCAGSTRRASMRSVP